MGKILRSSQKLFTEGPLVEKVYLKEELHLRVKAFQQRCNGLHIWEREQELMKVVEGIYRGQEDLEFPQQVIRSGGWLLELEGCYKRTRWLKDLMRRR